MALERIVRSQIAQAHPENHHALAQAYRPRCLSQSLSPLRATHRLESIRFVRAIADAHHTQVRCAKSSNCSQRFLPMACADGLVLPRSTRWSSDLKRTTHIPNTRARDDTQCHTAFPTRFAQPMFQSHSHPNQTCAVRAPSFFHLR